MNIHALIARNMLSLAGVVAMVLLLVLAVPPAAGLRDVKLVMPPVVRAGSTVALLCLFDLEGAPLYSVKWYRGSFEFYRYMPNETPDRQAFAYPDIHVDLIESGERKVTLRRVPLHMSGAFTCEVSADAPSFKTIVAVGNLLVLDTIRQPVVTVSKVEVGPGDELEANCTVTQQYVSAPAAAPQDQDFPRRGHRPPLLPPVPPGPPGRLPLLPETPPLQPHQLTPRQREHLQRDGVPEPPTTYSFWINNHPAHPWDVHNMSSASGATLRKVVAEDDFSSADDLRIKCVASVAGLYRHPSPIVKVRRKQQQQVPDVPPELHIEDDDAPSEPRVEEVDKQRRGYLAGAQPSSGSQLSLPSGPFTMLTAILVWHLIAICDRIRL